MVGDDPARTDDDGSRNQRESDPPSDVQAGRYSRELVRDCIERGADC